MQRLMEVPVGSISLEGMLHIPTGAQGIVIFAHGSGSGRLSPRNNFVADILSRAGLATLLIDLLSKQEDLVYQTRFDIDLLQSRLRAVIEWLKLQPETQTLRCGLFGASTGAAAALQVAALIPKQIQAVVSRGGRPDLVMELLDQVKAPTLLIVGGSDFAVLELNEQAYNRLQCTKKYDVIPNATHLFEEKGCLDEVAKHATEWFKKYLM